MSGPLKETLTDVTSEILETMFFVLPEPLESQISERDELAFHVLGRISLGGATQVTLNLFLPMPLAKEMTGNFMGMEPEEVDDESLLDVTQEMLNMIAGNLLNRLGGNAGFELGIPDSTLAERTLAVSEVEEDKHIFIEIDEEIMMLSVTKKEK